MAVLGGDRWDQGAEIRFVDGISWDPKRRVKGCVEALAAQLSNGDDRPLYGFTVRTKGMKTCSPGAVLGV